MKKKLLSPLIWMAGVGIRSFSGRGVLVFITGRLSLFLTGSIRFSGI